MQAAAPSAECWPAYAPFPPPTQSQVGLASLVMRHYTWSGLAEARKVLGGAGPGLLQIPGSVLWAGIRCGARAVQQGRGCD